MKYHTQQWFYNRIKKRIYRLTDFNCNEGRCRVCKEVFEKGLVMKNKMQARYVYEAQNELHLEYADKKPINHYDPKTKRQNHQ